MKENEFLDGVSNIQPDVVERFVSMDNQLQKKANKPKSKGIWLRFGAIAACFLLVVSTIIFVPMLREDDLPDAPTWDTAQRSSEEIVNLPAVPTWDTAEYSAEEIANWFNAMKYDSLATNAYTKIYVPNSKYLYIDDMTDDEYLNLYQYVDEKKELSKDELQNYIDTFLPQLAESLDASVPQLTIEEHNYSTGKGLSVSTDIGSYHMSIVHSGTRSLFGLSNLKGDRRIVIEGEAIQIDQRLSDEEILDSIQSIKNKLFDIFNVSFSDAKIIRSFGSYSKHGAEHITIYFYDESAHSLNSLGNRPITDYICISFDNFSNYAGDIVSDSLLKVSGVDYVKNWINMTDVYAVTASAKKISINEAEALLYNGYVFGGHSCPLCMKAQDKVSFEGYDFVDIEYVFGYDYETGKPTVEIPFYAFYKNIGTSENGNSIYAKTYVAAIEISGYDEYFESQKDNHSSGWYRDEVG